ncbi:hypothetical protein DV737_g2704, partial [Chaetothyriales sp. CBS 132003]
MAARCCTRLLLRQSAAPTSLLRHSAAPRIEAGFSARAVPSLAALSRYYASSSFPPHTVISMPALSPTMTAGSIGAWQKAVGDSLNPGDVLVEIETDKAQMDFEFQEEGVLAKILKETGEKEVPVGTPIAVLVEEGGDVSAFESFTLADAGGDKAAASMRKTIASRLKESVNDNPHYFVSTTLSVTKLLKLRESLNASSGGAYKLSVNDFLIKACAVALKKVPAVNSSWREIDGQNVESIGLAAISSQVKDLGKRARDGKLKPEEYQGGTFTISNMGMNAAVERFTAVINPPQAAILAVGTTRKVAVPVDTDDGTVTEWDDQIVVTGSFDHKVVDGAVGGEWIRELKKVVENPIAWQIIEYELLFIEYEHAPLLFIEYAYRAGHDLKRPPYLHAMLAGGIGGTSGDILMHSLDTVKTRQQADPHWPPKYTTLSASYSTIFRQEGVRRGLYGGFTAAMLGSFPGTVIFFGTYEWCKRAMLDRGIMPSVSYLASGFIADLAASVVYVPSEVLKTRLQLQGRYNNPFFYSGYNYRSTWDAARTIAATEGFGALYSGYKATLVRDLPFSALQFAFYEQERRLAIGLAGTPDIGLPLEVLTAVTAGSAAGVLTCPLDVVKTRTQTQISPHDHATSSQAAHMEKAAKLAKSHSSQSRLLHSGPRTVPTTAPAIDTSSVLTGLRLVYRTEGLAGCFRGVGPRAVWTGVQTGTMLVLYQYLLKYMQALSPGQDPTMI